MKLVRDNNTALIEDLTTHLTQVVADGKASSFDCSAEELQRKIEMIKMFGYELSNNVVAVTGLSQTFYKAPGHGWTYYSELRYLDLEDDNNFDEERFVVSLSRVYRYSRNTSGDVPKSLILLYQNREDTNPKEIVDEADLDITWRTCRMNIYKESENSILFNTHRDGSYLYRLDKENNRVVALKKMEGSNDLTMTSKSIEKINIDGNCENVFSFSDLIVPAVVEVDEDGEETETEPEKVIKQIKILNKEPERLSRVLGFRAGLTIEKAKLFAETEDKYMFMFRFTSGNSYKSCFVEINKNTGDVEYTKDNGRASIVKVTDHEGNMSVNFYNTTSKRVANIATQKDKKNTYNFESLDTYRVTKSEKSSGKYLPGIYTIDAKEGLKEVDVLTTANSQGKNRYSNSSEETVTIIVKDNELWLREQTIGNYSWGDTFDITEIKDKKLIDLKDAQREFLINYFDVSELEDIEHGGNGSRYYGWSGLTEVYKPVLQYDRVSEELMFLKNIDLGSITDFLTGNPTWRMESYYNDESKRNRLLTLFKKYKKNQTVYKFSISDNNFKTLKKFVMDKSCYGSIKEQQRMLEKSQATLDLANKKNSIVSL